jgi:molybdopterin-containing oxidoreductase family iron-sulfur binding subunit
MITRRDFLKVMGAATVALAVEAGLRSRLLAQSPEYLPASEENLWGMVVDVEKCTKAAAEGCRKCVKACHSWNNVPESGDSRIDPQWIRIVKISQKFPNAEPSYMPMLCMHCRNPACVQVCPTGASFVRKDGIVLIDMHRCIGCRYCMIACPYKSRNLNFFNPREDLEEINPLVPTREEGVVEKCDFCAGRLDKGKLPACVEVCPTNALIFGNLNDPTSEVSRIVATGKVHQLRTDLGTSPKVYYYKL